MLSVRCKAKSVQRRPGREKRLVPRTDCACSPVQEGEGSHRAHEIHDDQREYASREQPKKNRMSVLGVEFSSEPDCDHFVHSTASDHGKKVPIVPIHQCDSNHRSKNHEEKRETEDRYEYVRQAGTSQKARVREEPPPSRLRDATDSNRSAVTCTNLSEALRWPDHLPRILTRAPDHDPSDFTRREFTF